MKSFFFVFFACAFILNFAFSFAEEQSPFFLQDTLVEGARGNRPKVDVKDDFVFKRIFGREQNIKLLYSLLNSILQGDPEITDLKICNGEIPKLHKDLRTTLLDIKTQIGERTYCDLEIQKRNTKEIEERAFHYLCSMEIEHSHPPLDLSDEYFENLPIEKQIKLIQDGYSYKEPHEISIWILGQNINELPGYRHEMCMSYQNQGPALKKGRIIFLEIPKFKKMLSKNGNKPRSMLENWLLFLHNPHDKRLPKDIEEINLAQKEFDAISSDSETRYILEERERYVQDRLDDLSVAFQEGVQKGLQEGRKEGRKEERKEGKKGTTKEEKTKKNKKF